MSTIGNVTSASSATYGAQLAQTSALKRSLNNLGDAIQKGNLSSAGAILTSLVKANPQYAISPDASQTQDPINQDFKAISDAIENNDASGTSAVWEQLKSELSKNGVTVNDGTGDTAKLLAENKASVDQSILSSVFGNSSSSTDLLLGGSTSSSSDSSGLESLVKDWLTYKAGGTSNSSGTTPSSFNVTA